MEKRKEIFNFVNVFNFILTLVLFVLWGSVGIMHGMIGAISWVLIKLVFAPIGVVLFLISLIGLIRSIIKKKNVFQSSISLILSVALSFPILMLVNIIPMAYPINLEDTSPAITIHSPFHEPVLVGWGGDTVETNAPHVIWASERWAYDLVIEPENVGSDKLEDYGVYDKEIYAPVSGVVVAAYDKEDDITPNTEEFISMEGNYVYIKINETQTFLLLNHLKKNSVDVKVGDNIEVGDYIGKVGNSGTTSEPHLHIHHQRQDPTKTVYPIFAEGLPLYFYDENDNSTMPTSREIMKSTSN
ncbi:M23 family metallopeptidase [Oceanirhabdus seepicola]|uniref:M23 family metallopeptidase n=1 Tax=Oceanirhabdus seepicola TaxID=2828781 RepID=A0A9J6NYT7_9CLOT|nr:M23 family metallopeptidase [Oceanirhabdus seepicola]MCM1988312.1 M23 family metallopeptidase [Oceanirhabdus seepicola]